jgi:hypothetical protein
MNEAPTTKAHVFSLVRRSAWVETAVACITVGLSRGSTSHPGPSSEMEQGGHLLARAGKALPRNFRKRQGLASIDPAGRPLPSPENPGSTESARPRR